MPDEPTSSSIGLRTNLLHQVAHGDGGDQIRILSAGLGGGFMDLLHHFCITSSQRTTQCELRHLPGDGLANAVAAGQEVHQLRRKTDTPRVSPSPGKGCRHPLATGFRIDLFPDTRPARRTFRGRTRAVRTSGGNPCTIYWRSVARRCAVATCPAWRAPVWCPLPTVGFSRRRGAGHGTRTIHGSPSRRCRHRPSGHSPVSAIHREWERTTDHSAIGRRLSASTRSASPAEASQT